MADAPCTASMQCLRHRPHIFPLLRTQKFISNRNYESNPFHRNQVKTSSLLTVLWDYPDYCPRLVGTSTGRIHMILI